MAHSGWLLPPGTALAPAKADVYGPVSELLAKATDKGAQDGELTVDDQERLVGRRARPPYG
ncbi:hypothetical protein E0500_033150 [Streptomyces sp. KM273126]|uniref:hypothetical protein n=1 Tax=Streptomyces sp. KM273126 TaxID=2545247 RepID=UPI00103BDCC1|nr:hypothetical protein [Streptomyces sp. KM273126]MBA2812040.1 hypothetical protein [Streptomyces sp. KM273126]